MQEWHQHEEDATGRDAGQAEQMQPATCAFATTFKSSCQCALSTVVTAAGRGLWGRLSTSFGYLGKQGYCTGSNTLGSPSGACHLFPTMLGETGSGMTVGPL